MTLSNTTLFLLFICVTGCLGDVYLHYPRGSNNRLTEANQNRQNNARLFDSQNNDKGGYCWGPQMYYYTGSLLNVQWTAQHSCGHENSDCDIILQYMCHENKNWWEDRFVATGTPTAPANSWDHVSNIPRDGYPNGNTGDPLTPDFCNPAGAVSNNNDRGNNAGEFNNCSPTRHDNVNNEAEPKYIYGLHETYEYYKDCFMRERNKGLFIAGRNLNENRGATVTRQNSNGNQVRNEASNDNGAGRNHGYECPEERDYYPYWHPQPWKDIAILTTRTEACSWMRSNSQNVRETNYCYMETPKTDPNTNNPANQQERIPSSELKCQQDGGSWRRVSPMGGGKPDCLPAPWSRDNHLGNGLDGFMNSYNWTIPNDPNPSCVFRIRYNITTKDGNWQKPYWKRTSGDKSPVSGNPDIWISPNTEFMEPAQAATAYRLRLAINTAQFGRTFQDRSHTFEIRRRPSSVPAGARIHNLSVRGRRGNIVQSYPSVEYDFVPNIMRIKTDDYIHIQWTGCDNGYGNVDGEGRDKTDRSNMVGLLKGEIGGNIPHALNETGENQFFDPALTQHLAWIGQTQCWSDDEMDLYCGEGNNDNCNDNNPPNDVPGNRPGDTTQNRDQHIRNCGKLNGAPTPYFDGGLVKIKHAARWDYICTRNNNYSNRSQKGVIMSSTMVQTFGIVLISMSAVGFAAAVVIAVAVKFAPSSGIAAAAGGV